MKRTIFKVVLGGVLIFLALPLFFEAEEETSAEQITAPSSSQAAYDDEAEMLPLVSNVSFPERITNALSNYGKSFKKIYATGPSSKNTNPAGKAASSNPYSKVFSYEDPDLRASAASSSSEIREMYISNPSGEDSSSGAGFSYGAGGGSISDFGPGGAGLKAGSGKSSGLAAAIKQTIHGNAPVKGLYETSSTEPVEAKLRSADVYKKVMQDVDSKTPSVSPQKAPRQYAEPTAKNNTKGNIGPAILTSDSSRVSAASSGNSTSSGRYVGIAGKNNNISSASSGSSSGFGGSGGRVGSDMLMPDTGNFDIDASITASNIRSVAAASSGRLNNGNSKGQQGANSANPGQQNPQQNGKDPGHNHKPNNPHHDNNGPHKPGATNPGNPPTNPNLPNPGGNDGGGEGEGEGEGPQNPDKPNPPAVEVFNPDKWPSANEPVKNTCKGPSDLDATFEERLNDALNAKNNPSSQQEKEEAQPEEKKNDNPFGFTVLESLGDSQEGKKETPADPDKIDASCSAMEFPQADERIASRYKVLVDAGAADESGSQFMIPASFSNVDIILSGIGMKNHVTAKSQNGSMDSFAPVSREEFQKYLDDNNTFILTVSNAIAEDERYERRALKIDQGQLERFTGVSSLIGALETKANQSEERSAQEQRANQESVAPAVQQIVRNLNK